MSIKFRLTAMQFLQFFVWGAWLISLGGYMGGTLHFEGGQIGAIFATMGIASLIMPGLTGIIADKWINAERLYGILHLIGAGALIYASTATTYNHMYWMRMPSPYSRKKRSEERRVGKECRSRWSPYH